jgi:peroxiredoxin
LSFQQPKKENVVDEKLGVEVGSEAPDFTLPSSEGVQIQLSDYRNREHVTLFFMREFT